MIQIRQFWLVWVLVFMGISCAKKPVKSLHEAAADGDIRQIQLHISQDTDVNKKNQDGQTLLHWAALQGHRDAATSLIDKGG